MSPGLRIEVTLKRTSSMKQEFFPFIWNSDVSHQLKRYQMSTSVSLNGTNIQQRVFEIHAALEPDLVDSFINVLKPICVREFSPSGLLKCFPQFWNHGIHMTSAVSFSFILIIMKYQSHDVFLRFRLEESLL